MTLDLSKPVDVCKCHGMHGSRTKCFEWKRRESTKVCLGSFTCRPSLFSNVAGDENYAILNPFSDWFGRVIM